MRNIGSDLPSSTYDVSRLGWLIKGFQNIVYISNLWQSGLRPDSRHAHWRIYQNWKVQKEIEYVRSSRLKEEYVEVMADGSYLLVILDIFELLGTAEPTIPDR